MQHIKALQNLSSIMENHRVAVAAKTLHKLYHHRGPGLPSELSPSAQVPHLCLIKKLTPPEKKPHKTKNKSKAPIIPKSTTHPQTQPH